MTANAAERSDNSSERRRLIEGRGNSGEIPSEELEGALRRKMTILRAHWSVIGPIIDEIKSMEGNLWERASPISDPWRCLESPELNRYSFVDSTAKLWINDFQEGHGIGETTRERISGDNVYEDSFFITTDSTQNNRLMTSPGLQPVLSECAVETDNGFKMGLHGEEVPSEVFKSFIGSDNKSEVLSNDILNGSTRGAGNKDEELSSSVEYSSKWNRPFTDAVKSNEAVDLHKIRRAFERMLTDLEIEGAENKDEVPGCEDRSPVYDRGRILDEIDSCEKEAEDSLRFLRRMAEVSREVGTAPDRGAAALQNILLSNIINKVETIDQYVTQVVTQDIA